MSFDPAEIEAGLEALSGIDFAAALAAFRAADLQGEIKTAADVAGVLALFFPPAAYAKDALIVLGLLAKLQSQGLIRPAQPEDPAMARVERTRGGR